MEKLSRNTIVSGTVASKTFTSLKTLIKNSKEHQTMSSVLNHFICMAICLDIEDFEWIMNNPPEKFGKMVTKWRRDTTNE